MSVQSGGWKRVGGGVSLEESVVKGRGLTGGEQKHGSD